MTKSFLVEWCAISSWLHCCTAKRSSATSKGSTLCYTLYLLFLAVTVWAGNLLSQWLTSPGKWIDISTSLLWNEMTPELSCFSFTITIITIEWSARFQQVEISPHCFELLNSQQDQHISVFFIWMWQQHCCKIHSLMRNFHLQTIQHNQWCSETFKWFKTVATKCLEKRRVVEIERFHISW